MATMLMDETVTTNNPNNPSKAVQAATVLQRSVCLTLTCRFLGNNRKVDLDALVGENQTDATIDESVFHATKRLLDPKVLRPALRVLSKAKAYLRSSAIAAHRVFGERSYLVPVALVEEVDERLQGFVKDLEHEVDVLLENYAEAVAQQKEKLGPHFRASDYGPAAEVRQAFGLDWSYVSFASPDRLETVSMALAQKSRAKYEARLSDAYEETVLQLRQSALEIMSGLVKKLGPGADGKMKILRGSALDDLLEFCDRLPSLNSIAGDDALTQAVAQVQARVQGLDVEQLRDSPALRQALLGTVAEAQQVLEGLVVSRGSRAISFGEDLA